MPSSAKYDDWIGISRCVAATSALTVSSPSVGGQSMTMFGYSLADRLEPILQPEMRVELPHQLRFELGQRNPRRGDAQIRLVVEGRITSAKRAVRLGDRVVDAAGDLA